MSVPDSQDTNKPADALLQAIKEWCERIEGFTPSKAELQKQAVDVIKRRLA